MRVNDEKTGKREFLKSVVSVGLRHEEKLKK